MVLPESKDQERPPPAAKYFSDKATEVIRIAEQHVHHVLQVGHAGAQDDDPAVLGQQLHDDVDVPALLEHVMNIPVLTSTSDVTVVVESNDPPAEGIEEYYY